MKKFRKLLCGAALGASLLVTAACGALSEDALTISSISHQLMADGSTRITIIYSDESIEPTVFYLPAGADGEKGTGISDITAVENADKTATIVTITYTDLTVMPTVITLPYGTFITNVLTSTDSETGDVTLTLQMSDGTRHEVKLRAGKDGKDGDTIKNIETEVGEDGRIFIVITLNGEEEGEPRQYRFPLPEGQPGDTGKGISYIEVDNVQTAWDPSYIHLIVYYDNGDQQDLAIPKPSGWITGTGAPGAGTGNIGDYYVDKTNKIIYYKETSTQWVVLIDLSAYNTETHTVVFRWSDDTSEIEQITHGSNFNAAGLTIPTPKKEGYEFIGWFTSADPTDVNAGQFTDLTAVMGDLILYARYREI